jgi:topoisomerase-4 subunit A
MSRFGLNDMQAEAVLNLRLRSLRRLEEFQIRGEHDKLSAERATLTALLGSEPQRWAAIGREVADIRKRFGEGALGKRRTLIAAAPDVTALSREAVIDREPVTILLSEKGWIRAVGGREVDIATVKYKEGDREGFVVKAETTDLLIVFSTDGKAFTIEVDKLPRGRGFGEPLRLMIDLGNDSAPLAVFRHQPGGKLLVAAGDARGFVVLEDDIIARTRAGKQVMTLPAAVEAIGCKPVDGDHVAVIGENRKLLIFPLAEMPELARGRGVILLKIKDGGLADAKVISLAAGLSWKQGERTRTESDLRPWLGARAQAGRIAPNGFPKNNRFG